TEIPEPVEGAAMPSAAAARVEGDRPIAGGELGGKLAGLSLPRQVLVLAVWPLLESLLTFLVGMVDLALAARLRPLELAEHATDALGVAGYVGWLMGMIHASVGVGAGALVARAVGGRHRRLANAALGQAILLGLAGGTVIGLCVYLGAGAIGSFAGVEGPGLALCVQYLRITSLAAPMSGMLFVGMACLRGAGDTRTPFVIMLMVNLVNVVASVTFVYAPAPLGGHGVAGIAAGTALAWTLGAANVSFVLIRGRGAIRLR